MKTIIEQQLKEFDEKFPKHMYEMINTNDNNYQFQYLLEKIDNRVKDFLKQSITKAVKSREEEIVEMIEERIISDDKVIAETPENKFARGKTNFILQDIKSKILNKHD